MRVNWLNRITSSFVFALLLQCTICSAGSPPLFQGEVNSANINVRSDATVSSEIICALGENYRVEVILELYDWYKIRLPQNAPSYIKKNLTACINIQSATENRCKNAKVLKDKVNIRLRPNGASPIIGVIEKNEVVNILNEKGGWYKIEPAQNSFGWINKRFVNPLTKDFGVGVNKAPNLEKR